MTRPPIYPIEKIDVPRPSMRRSANGVRLYTLDCAAQEVVRFSFVFHAGSADQKVPFSASSTANLLSEGTAHHTAQQIAEMLDFLGSYFDVSMDRNWAVVTFVTLGKYFERTLDIAREILLAPTFAEHEVAVYREKRKQRLSVERSKVATRARERFGAALFGDGHPYGIFYDESLYDSLTRDDVSEFYRRRYTAENCFVVCSGCVDAAKVDMLAALAGDIPTGGETATPPFPAPESTRFTFVPHEGAVQSAVRAGTLLFPRTHPDFTGMQVLSTVLGGYFGSRLVRNLREERGYTYGVFSTMVNLQNSGYLAIASEVAADATDDSLVQIAHEIEALRRVKVPAAELEMVKNIMTGEVMRVLDGPFGIADVTIENVSNGVDNDYNAQWLDEVRATTPERLLALAERYLDTDEFVTVVVGGNRPGAGFGRSVSTSRE